MAICKETQIEKAESIKLAVRNDPFVFVSS
jgi:hypothetical protein